MVVVTVLLTLYFGYLGSRASWFLFAFTSIMPGTWIQLSVYSVLPVPQGRRERVLVGVASALAGCVAATAMLGIAVGVTRLAAPGLPEIQLQHATLRFHALQPWGLWVPWAISCPRSRPSG
jgi:hypothetical protein